MVQERLMMKKIESKGNGILVFFRNFEIHYKTLRYDCQIWIVSCFTTNKQKKKNEKMSKHQSQICFFIFFPFDLVNQNNTNLMSLKDLFTIRWWSKNEANLYLSMTTTTKQNSFVDKQSTTKKKRRKKIWNDNDNDAFLIKKKKTSKVTSNKKKIQLFFLLPYSFSIHFNNIDDDGDEKGA